MKGGVDDIKMTRRPGATPPRPVARAPHGAHQIMSGGHGKWDEHKHPRNHGKFSSSPGAGASSGPGAPGTARSMPRIPAPGERPLPSIPAIPAHLRPGARPAVMPPAPLRVPDIAPIKPAAAAVTTTSHESAKPKAKPPKPRASRAKKPSEPAAPAAMPSSLVGVEGKAFGDAVQEAADRAPLEHGYGPDKVFVHRVYEHLKPRLGDLSLADFKRKLVTSNRDQHINLSRADLVGAMNHADVAGAEIKDKGASFHFIGRKDSTGAKVSPVPAEALAKPPKPRAARAKKPAAPKLSPSPKAAQARTAPTTSLATADDATFAAAVQHAARTHERAVGLGPDRRTYISDVHDAMKPQLGNMSLDQFKGRLVNGFRGGHLALERQDMIDPSDTDEMGRIGRSEVEDLGARFHHVTHAISAPEIPASSEPRHVAAPAPAPPVISPRPRAAGAKKPRSQKKPAAKKPPKPRSRRAKARKS